MDDFVHLMNEDKVVAVGEVGLDYYRTTDEAKQKKQKDVFKQFINLAYQFQKPIILHCRDAAAGSKGRSHKDAIEILRSAKNILYGGVAHSFTGTLEEAREYLNLGFHLGFTASSLRQAHTRHSYPHSLEKILLESHSRTLPRAI